VLVSAVIDSPDGEGSDADPGNLFVGCPAQVSARGSRQESGGDEDYCRTRVSAGILLPWPACSIAGRTPGQP